MMMMMMMMMMTTTTTRTTKVLHHSQSKIITKYSSVCTRKHNYTEIRTSLLYIILYIISPYVNLLGDGRGLLSFEGGSSRSH
jgi:hypothetical protein